VTKARILIVDDEAQAREILARLLERRGHLVTCAGSAEEARRVAAGAPFDLVLLDHVLPGATGLATLRELRGLVGAPVYLMSGYADEEFREDARLVGAAGFFSKPLDFPAIEALVDGLPEAGA
jgi:CheY-like chemotaxis protein